MELKNIKLEKEDRLAIITISRPASLNALNSETLNELGAVLDDVQDDDSIRCVLLTGDGDKAFVAGADIKEMSDLSPIQTRTFMKKGQQVLLKLEDLDKPVIAVINGFALGGGLELALSCDILLASERAKLGLPEVTLGIHPGFGGTQRLPRLVGKARAKELIFTGKMIGPTEAMNMGLLNAVYPPVELMTRAKELAASISKNAPLAIRLAKGAVNRGTEVDLITGLAIEAEAEALAFSTQDAKEGMNAFIEKRKPDFKGL